MKKLIPILLSLAIMSACKKEDAKVGTGTVKTSPEETQRVKPSTIIGTKLTRISVFQDLDGNRLDTLNAAHDAMLFTQNSVSIDINSTGSVTYSYPVQWVESEKLVLITMDSGKPPVPFTVRLVEDGKRWRYVLNNGSFQQWELGVND